MPSARAAETTARPWSSARTWRRLGGRTGVRRATTTPPRARPPTRPGVEAAVDLGAHDLAVGRGMVVAAEQRAGEVGAGVLQPGDLLVERGRAAAGRWPSTPRPAPALRMPSMSSSARPASCSMPMNTSRRSVASVAALTRLARVGGEQAAPFVVADVEVATPARSGDLADRSSVVFVHATT